VALGLILGLRRRGTAVSDDSQFPGWRQASDGKWYPAESFPSRGGDPPQVQRPRTDPTGASRQLPPKTRNQYTWFWVVAILVVVGLGTGIAVRFSNGTVAKKHTIVYSVTGTGRADIQWDPSGSFVGNALRANDVALPWTETIKDQTLGSYNLGVLLLSGTTVTCTLTIDGHQVSTQSSIGPGAAPACSFDSSYDSLNGSNGSNGSG
jgi:hypothetical protein